MNTVSVFAVSPTANTWFQIVIGLCALTMASRLSPANAIRQDASVPLSLPLGFLVGLAVTSIIAGLMQPELLAAAFALA